MSCCHFGHHHKVTPRPSQLREEYFQGGKAGWTPPNHRSPSGLPGGGSKKRIWEEGSQLMAQLSFPGVESCQPSGGQQGFKAGRDDGGGWRRGRRGETNPALPGGDQYRFRGPLAALTLSLVMTLTSTRPTLGLGSEALF